MFVCKFSFMRLHLFEFYQLKVKFSFNLFATNNKLNQF